MRCLHPTQTQVVKMSAQKGLKTKAPQPNDLVADRRAARLESVRKRLDADAYQAGRDARRPE